MWKKIIDLQRKKDYFQNIAQFLKAEKMKNKVIYPETKDIFTAFHLTAFHKVKAVILGQDPYHGENQAHGLSFSVKGQKRPPTLNNIFKELKNDLNIESHQNNLTPWALEGVLMLNSILTVQKNKPLSHQNIGWQTFTQIILESLQTKKNVVYLLWGKFAQTYEKYIISQNNYIIKSPHPSPFSAANGFFGSKHFSKTNLYLKSHNIQEINWQLH
ncbi:Uracil-DNA glycosylase [Candidatus Phytoplasma australiense]|uniref:Uracil-DNA glycosylase n=2 Tax=Phytoplasma australiense TaxID=59748 RepID=B1VA82_PHYAS|nr:uracil-DNA glycosylase [Candidatus Phytoplasma australiense]AGL90232.1 Uracil-DNA glycosylase [Strawberry lethal yellows phytoplasma (CPA) str. NZSb11]CAM11855.1 Uracil-DNA glycosylase [Candidatus Phytoplasma australiense]